MSEAPEPQVRVMKSGRELRSIRVDGEEVFGPFQVRLRVRTNFLAGSEENLDFYIYAETGENAVRSAGMLLEKWVIRKRRPYDGYPKPEGLAAARAMTHRAFKKTLEQLSNTTRHIEKAGVQSDPWAFFSPPLKTAIYDGLPGGNRPMEAPDRSTLLPTPTTDPNI